MTEPWASLSRDAIEVINSALAGEGDAVADAFDAVVDREGLTGAYDVAWCLAATTVGPHAPPGVWTLDFPDIEEAPYEARWVARFLSAYANFDGSTGAALFRAAAEDGRLSDCLLTLAGSTAATIRHRQQ